ncbi:hypothetical protein Tco_1148723 [Tanacetum coccineum]
MAQTIVSTMAGHKSETEMATKDSTSNTTTTEAKAIPIKRKKEKQAAGLLLLPRAVSAKEYPRLRGAIKALHATRLQILLLSIAFVLFIILRLQVDIILVSKVINGDIRHGAGMDHKKPRFELRRSTMEENGSYGSECTCTPSFSSLGLQGFNLSLDYCSWNLLGTS